MKKRKTRRKGEAGTRRKSRGAARKGRAKRKVLRKTRHECPACKRLRKLLPPHNTCEPDPVRVAMREIIVERLAALPHTKYAVAARTGLHRQTIADYLTNKVEPGIDAMLLLCRRLFRCTYALFVAEAEERCRRKLSKEKRNRGKK